MSHPDFHPWLKPWTPFLRWLPETRKTWKADFIAGLTGAVVVLPQGVAFAVIAGMPPEYGLYAGMVPAIIAAFFGSSRLLVSGPTTAASIVLFSSLSAFAEPGSAQYVTLALTLTFMVGVIELVLGLARAGTLVNFISHSVVVGFTAGAAVWIAAKQIKNFFGIDIPRDADLVEVFQLTVAGLPHVNPYITAVGAATLISGVLVKKLWPKLPFLLVAMVVGSLVSLLLNRMYGFDVTGIVTVGALPDTLPPLSAPDLSLATIKELAPAALAVTLFALTEAVSIGRSLAQRTGQRIDGNQEFIGQGLSNLAGSFFSGYVATGSFNRSGINYSAGAKTPLAAIFAGLLLMMIVVMVAPLAAYLPKAAMGGLLFLVAYGLIDFKEIKHILHASRPETAIMATTFFSALFLELEFAIFLGVMLSLLLYLNRTSRPQVLLRVPDPVTRKFTTNPYLPQCPQFGIVRIDGSLYFGAVNHVEEQLAKVSALLPGQTKTMVVCQGINHVDVSGVDVLTRLAEERRKAGGDLYLYDVKPQVMDLLRKSGALKAIGEDHVFDSKTGAMAAIVPNLDLNICAACPHSVFGECTGNKQSTSSRGGQPEAG